MAKNENGQVQEGMKVVTTLTFNNKLGPDKNLMSLVNAVCRLPKNRGIPTTSMIRNHLERTLERELKEARIEPGAMA